MQSSLSYDEILLENLLVRQEMMWKQKALDDHVRLGDRNTRFFIIKLKEIRGEIEFIAYISMMEPFWQRLEELFLMLGGIL